MTAREEILGRIRRALDPAGSPTGPHPGYDRHVVPVGSERLVELFAERLRDYKALVHVVPAAEIPATIAAAVARRGARAMVAPAGVPDAWLTPGVDWHRDSPPLTPRELDTFDGVLTTSAVAIAVTGTIVLDGTAGQGRRAVTLVPDHHLCVVRTVVRDVADALALLAADRPLTWISGPSATSDIELDRVEGVHGPRTLEVVLAFDG
ncbi:LutC/YkgG family protein [Longispora urticae]